MRRAFTLTELLYSLVIISILASVSFTQLLEVEQYKLVDKFMFESEKIVEQIDKAIVIEGRTSFSNLGQKDNHDSYWVKIGSNYYGLPTTMKNMYILSVYSTRCADGSRGYILRTANYDIPYTSNKRYIRYESCRMSSPIFRR